MTTNQYIKPSTLERKENLFIGGCDCVELAKTYGTPLYVLDEKTIRDICNDYKNAFKKYPHTKMMYASKALCTSAVARILDSEGFGFDTVSIGEIYTVHKAGVDLSKVLFNGNNKSEEELDYAIKNTDNISGDTLTDSLSVSQPQGYVKTWDINGEELTIGVTKIQ